ncbi:transcription factor IME1 SCDLUD_000099 [Saccharomycodes ludwigii]|uniref:transcription factor IME1 n=1 Tax=Saccharomycodes ludwigii TaxID=36035 RepID=UPI001E8271AF|nr:hypothetical protein SCDLUD_000099 [Saccharomycodes ludwigii]KAH3902521.1 hypothetical protein SCDLUD_000099 [Saccharomycodes ludwigii]
MPQPNFDNNLKNNNNHDLSWISSASVFASSPGSAELYSSEHIINTAIIESQNINKNNYDESIPSTSSSVKLLESFLNLENQKIQIDATNTVNAAAENANNNSHSKLFDFILTEPFESVIDTINNDDDSFFSHTPQKRDTANVNSMRKRSLLEEESFDSFDFYNNNHNDFHNNYFLNVNDNKYEENYNTNNYYYNTNPKSFCDLKTPIRKKQKTTGFSSEIPNELSSTRCSTLSLFSNSSSYTYDHASDSSSIFPFSADISPFQNKKIPPFLGDNDAGTSSSDIIEDFSSFTKPQKLTKLLQPIRFKKNSSVYNNCNTKLSKDASDAKKQMVNKKAIVTNATINKNKDSTTSDGKFDAYNQFVTPKNKIIEKPLMDLFSEYNKNSSHNNLVHNENYDGIRNNDMYVDFDFTIALKDKEQVGVNKEIIRGNNTDRNTKTKIVNNSNYKKTKQQIDLSYKLMTKLATYFGYFNEEDQDKMDKIRIQEIEYRLGKTYF